MEEKFTIEKVELFDKTWYIVNYKAGAPVITIIEICRCKNSIEADKICFLLNTAEAIATKLRGDGWND